MLPRERLRAYRKSKSLSRSALARLIGCHPSYVGLVEDGKRKPGADFTHAVERLTKGARGGPIRTEEWLAQPPHTPNVGRGSAAGEVSR